MNRENYDPKILSTFNIIGSYFVDYYYNQLYHSSRRIHEKHARSSLTDEYKRAVQVFYEECNRNKNQYTLVITRLHEYYKSTTKFSTILLQDFTSKILSHFLPDEHYSVMNSQEKSYFLKKIIVNIIRDFTIYVSQIDTLLQVIDDHSNRQNVQIWMNHIVDIQIRVRENLWHNFISQGKAQTVNIDLFNRMQDDRNKLWDVLQVKVAEIEQLKHDIANARKIVEHYSLENVRLSDEITRLTNGAVIPASSPPSNNIQRGARDRVAKPPAEESRRDEPAESSESEPSDTESSGGESGSETEHNSRRAPPRRGSNPRSPAKTTPKRRNAKREQEPAKRTPRRADGSPKQSSAPVQTSSNGDMLIDFTESIPSKGGEKKTDEDPFATPV